MSISDFNSVTHHRWDQIPAEPLKGTITRRLITGERMMIAHVYLKKGDDVLCTLTITSSSHTSSRAHCIFGSVRTASGSLPRMRVR